MSSSSQAVDTIGPAFERTIKQLFKPFRIGHWLRLGVVSLLTWEFAGGGFNFPGSGGPSDTSEELLAATPAVPVIIGASVAAVILFLFLTYVASVFRFILFDSVLNDRCAFAEGWARWQRQGRSLFLWWLGFAANMIVIFTALFGVPAGLAWVTGVFDAPGEHVVLLVIAGVVLFFAFVALVIATLVTSLAVKDWVVPLMALENIGVLEGWRRLWPMVNVNKSAYILFVVMKALLALGSAIFFTILYVIVALMLFLAVLLPGIIAAVVGQAAGFTWSPGTIALVSVVGGIVILVVLYLMALIYAPAMVFFQAYALHFFGTHYPKLGELLESPTPPTTLEGPGATAAPPSPVVP
jgi:hypothetical protein